jgi:hypothetical protein
MKSASWRGFSTGLIWIVLYAVVSAGALLAQNNTSTITGEVKDQSGAVIPDSVVTATNIETGIQKSATSDSGGRYTLLDLSPGHYDLKVTHAGFATLIQRNQELLVGTTITIAFPLTIAAANEVVEVDAAAAVQVETTQNTVSRIQQTNELDTLPSLTRNFAELATMAPGVQSAGVNTAGTAAGSAAKASNLISLGNSPTYETGFIVDGITNEGGNQGGPYVQLAQDWVQEFSVLTQQLPAEYGAAAGGVVNTVTRSGGNQIHGRAYYFSQNSVFNSNPEFFTGTTKAPFESNRVGGTVGGPIAKNKLFYFGGIEYFHNTITNALSATAISTPYTSTAQPIGTSQDALVPWYRYGTETSAQLGATSGLGTIRLDYTPNAANSFFLRNNIDYEYLENNGYGGVTTLGAASQEFSPNYTEVIGWTRTLSPSVVNVLLATFMSKLTTDSPTYWAAKGLYTGIGVNPNPYNYISTASIGGATTLGNPDGNWPQVVYNGVTVGASTAGGIHSSEVDEVISDTLTLTRGRHDVKVGGLLRRYDIINHNGFNASEGTYTFAGTVTAPFNPANPILQTSFPNAERNAPLSYSVDAPYANLLSSSVPSYSIGFFAQDSWKIREDLTLNYGLRYDFANTNSALSNDSFPGLSTVVPGSVGFIQAGFHPINNDAFDISPRFGFAWTPFHDGQKTLIRGGIGIFYDQDDTATTAVYVSGNSLVHYAYSFSANTTTSNPYCVGNTTCAAGVPAADEIAVVNVLAAALSNYTLPQFPVSTSPCAATNSCTVTVGPNTYTVPALSVPLVPQGGRLNINPNYKVPGVTQVTIGMQREFGSLSVAADFAFHYLFNGANAVNDNVAITGVGNSTTTTTINPAYTNNATYYSNGYLKTEDLDIQASYHDRRGDVFHTAYQFGYAHDNSFFNFGFSAHGQVTTNPFNPDTDYGPSFNDARNTLSASGQFKIKYGLEISPILQFTSALPYTATSSAQAPGSAAAPPSCLPYYSRCYPVANGVTYTRDSLRGDDYLSLNGRLSEDIKIHGSKTLSFYFEGFNTTNKHNLGTNFNTNVDNAATFQKPSGTSLPLRQLQLGTRFDF